MALAIYSILTFLVAVFSLLIGLLVIIRKHDNNLNIIWFILCLFICGWNLGYFFTMVPDIPYNIALISSRLSHASGQLIPLFFFIFTLIFLGLDKTKKNEIIIASFFCLIIATLCLTPFVVIRLDPKLFMPLYPVGEIGYAIYVINFLFWVIYSHLLYLSNYSALNAAKRSQINYFLIGTIVGFVGGSTCFPLIFGYSFSPIASILIIAYPFTTSYAITKTRLMDISVIISKSLAYGTTIVILGIFYLCFVIPYRIFVSSNIDIGFISMSIAIGIFVGFIFERLRMFIQTSSDKVFLKGKFDLAKTSADVAGRLSSIVSFEALSEALEHIRVNDIESTLLELHLLEDGPSDERTKSNIASASDDPLKEFFSENRMITSAARLPKQLSKSLQKNVEYISPCYSADILIALLFIGRKLSEDPYSSDEIAVFKVLAPQIATVIERIKPYEKIKREFDSAQKKLYETEKMLSRSARLASLGTLTAGVTHEIRNPLAVIRTETELLPKEERNRQYLLDFKDLIIQHVERIANIIDKMLHLSKAKEAVNKSIDINSLIEQYIVGMVSSKNVNMETRLNPVPDVYAIEDDLHQVLINLTSNAIKAMTDGGTLTIKTYEAKENGGSKAVIEVSDTGTGIPQENLEKIFDPFFSTWENGTGLGLSISYKIIEELKGRIEVHSEIGRGSTFKIILPAAT